MMSVKVSLFENPSVAPKFTRPEYKPAQITCFNVVRNGTEGGRSTVDLVFEDEKGQKYIVMLTGRLLKFVCDTVGEEK